MAMIAEAFLKKAFECVNLRQMTTLAATGPSAIRRRIRAIIVRQKKRPRFLLRHLLALGVGRSAAAGAA